MKFNLYLKKFSLWGEMDWYIELLVEQKSNGRKPKDSEEKNLKAYFCRE